MFPSFYVRFVLYWEEKYRPKAKERQAIPIILKRSTVLPIEYITRMLLGRKRNSLIFIILSKNAEHTASQRTRLAGSRSTLVPSAEKQTALGIRR